RDLPQPRGLDLGDTELRDVAAEGLEPLVAPRAHQAGETPARNAVFLLQHRAELFGVEQAERAFEYRTQFIAGLQHVDGLHFHQRFQPLGKRRLAAADRAEQVEDLLALFETLRCVAEETNDALDRFLHSVEAGERRIGTDRAIQKDTAKAWVLGRV